MFRLIHGIKLQSRFFSSSRKELSEEAKRIIVLEKKIIKLQFDTTCDLTKLRSDVENLRDQLNHPKKYKDGEYFVRVPGFRFNR